MSEEGKADREFFEARVRPHLGAKRDDVALGPTYGVDFGVVDLGDRVLAVASDPISILPDLGLERAGRFAILICLADVAVSGLAPTHVAPSFHLPPGTTDAEFEAVWRGMSAELSDLGTAVVAGHTGRYEGCRFPWVGGATAMALGDPGDLVRPDGAGPGDRVVLANSPAVESAALLAALFGDRIDLPDDVLRAADDRVLDATGVRAALTAAAAGPVTAIHDATERGIANALREMADAADVGFRIERDRAPTDPDVERICDHFGIDPWVAGSAGTLVVTVPPDGVDVVVEALDAEGVAAAEVGEVTGDGRILADGEPLAVPGEDPFAAVYADLLEG